MGEDDHGGRDARRPGEDEEQWRLRVLVNRTLDGIGRKLLVFSGKGGVGKSTVAANLAVSLAGSGRRVGLLDIDFHGPSIPRLMGLQGRRMDRIGDELIPVDGPGGVLVVSLGLLLADADQAAIWRGPMKMGVIQQLLGNVAWGGLDWLIIDAPPGTGDEPLSVAQLIPGALGLLVTTPQQLATDDARRGIAFARKVGLELVGLLENMAGLHCPHCGGLIELFTAGGGFRLAEASNVPFLGSVPLDPEAVRLGDGAGVIVSELPDSPAAVALRRAFTPLLEIEQPTGRR